MLAALTTLLVFQLIGEVLVHVTGLPVPGPVIGMALLFLALSARGELPDTLRNTANGVLQHLSLLFVPAGVGVMVHYARVADELPAIAVSVVASTVLAIAATAWVMNTLLARRGP